MPSFTSRNFHHFFLSFRSSFILNDSRKKMQMLSMWKLSHLSLSQLAHDIALCRNVLRSTLSTRCVFVYTAQSKCLRKIKIDFTITRTNSTICLWMRDHRVNLHMPCSRTWCWMANVKGRFSPCNRCILLARDDDVDEWDDVNDAKFVVQHIRKCDWIKCLRLNSQ